MSMQNPSMGIIAISEWIQPHERQVKQGATLAYGVTLDDNLYLQNIRIIAKANFLTDQLPQGEPPLFLENTLFDHLLKMRVLPIQFIEQKPINENNVLIKVAMPAEATYGIVCDINKKDSMIWARIWVVLQGAIRLIQQPWPQDVVKLECFIQKNQAILPGAVIASYEVKQG